MSNKLFLAILTFVSSSTILGYSESHDVPGTKPPIPTSKSLILSETI